MFGSFVRQKPDLEGHGIDPSSAAWTLQASELYCRDVTRREAKNFYWGFVALPREQRIAIYALYGFARQVDDAADLPGESCASDRFVHHHDRLNRCLAGEPDDPVTQVLSHAIKRYGIPREDLEALIRGVESDLSMNRYDTWDDLREYCLLVASAIGRMCVHIFGFRDSEVFRYADDLGIAMQLANILRDVREDAQMGRVYLPQEDLEHFGVDERVLCTGQADLAWDALVRFEIARARDHFNSGLKVADYIPRRASVCVFTMAGIYMAILNRLADDPYLPLRQRARVDTRGKIGILLRSCLQAA